MALFKTKETTKNLFIGIPEAEAEANVKARVKLEDVFSDYLDVIPEIETEKFLLVGRKGSGKTAVGQHLFKKAKVDPNYFCDFVRKSDIDLEHLVQVSINEGHEIEKELLYKWIILTRILKLIVQNYAVESHSGVKLLKKFLDKNSGFIKLDRYEIKEQITAGGFTVFIEFLSRFFRASGNKTFQIKGEKAPFYKLIPHLEDAILDVLTSVEDNDNSYLLIFDDLDIEFKANKTESVDSLLNLIRITKHYNNNFFSDNDINAKVLLLLRNDISDVLIKKSADMAKIFSSYSIPLVWYEHDLYRRDENLLKLKQFIDSRILKALNQKGIKNIEKNPWNYLIDATDQVNETSFKYIINHTFYSPRDLLLLFKSIHKFNFEIPLQLNELNILIGKYAEEAKGEIDNAMAIYLNHEEIGNVWKVLNETTKRQCFTYQFLIEKIAEQKFEYDPSFIVLLMFEYSLIGNKHLNSNRVEFKYRDELMENIKLDQNMELINHRIVGIYCKNHKA